MMNQFLEKLLSKKKHIGIAGNIGVGKTTMATKIADYFKAKKELGFGVDKADREIGISYKAMKQKLGVR